MKEVLSFHRGVMVDVGVDSQKSTLPPAATVPVKAAFSAFLWQMMSASPYASGETKPLSVASSYQPALAGASPVFCFV